MAFCVHILGVYCCLREKKELQVQRILLINLSAVEMMTVVYMVLFHLLNFVHFTPDERRMTNIIFLTAYHIVTVLFYSSMVLIAVDRLISALHPTAYFVHVRKSRMKKAVQIIWFCSFTTSLLGLTLSMSDHTSLILYMSFSAQFVFISITITAYTLASISQFRSECDYTFFHRQLGCLAFSLRFWTKIKQLLSNCPASDLTFSSKTADLSLKRVKINYKTKQLLSNF